MSLSSPFIITVGFEHLGLLPVPFGTKTLGANRNSEDGSQDGAAHAEGEGRQKEREAWRSAENSL